MKIPSLESNKQDLLNLFPIDLDNLNVFVPLNNGEDLQIIFYQKNTYDSNRNWDIWDTWHKQGMNIKERRKKLADIYFNNDRIIHSGFLSKEDKLLLSIDLEKELDLESVAHLANINSHRCYEMFGVAKKFYNNLRAYLKEKDFNHISCAPLHSKLIPYWESCGFQSLREFKNKEMFTKSVKYNNREDSYYIDKLK